MGGCLGEYCEIQCDAECAATLCCGAFALAFALFDAHWISLHLRHVAVFRKHPIVLVLAPGLFSACNALSSPLRKLTTLLMDLQMVLKIWWVYHAVMQDLTLFNPEGFCGQEEAVDAWSRLTDGLELAPVTMKLPCCWPCTGRRYRPDATFVRQALARVHFFLYGSAITLLARQAAETYNKLDPSREESASGELLSTESSWAVATQYLAIIDIALSIIGQSGKMPLDTITHPLLVPEKQWVVKRREKAFLFFFLWINNVNIAGMSIITTYFNSLFWAHHRPIFVAVQMLFFQFVVHAAYVPSAGAPDFYSWWPHYKMRPELKRISSHAEAIELIAQHDVHFTCSREEVAAKLGVSKATPILRSTAEGAGGSWSGGGGDGAVRSSFGVPQGGSGSLHVESI